MPGQYSGAVPEPAEIHLFCTQPGEQFRLRITEFSHVEAMPDQVQKFGKSGRLVRVRMSLKSDGAGVFKGHFEVIEPLTRFKALCKSMNEQWEDVI